RVKIFIVVNIYITPPILFIYYSRSYFQPFYGSDLGDLLPHDILGPAVIPHAGIHISQGIGHFLGHDRRNTVGVPVAVPYHGLIAVGRLVKQIRIGNDYGGQGVEVDRRAQRLVEFTVGGRRSVTFDVGIAQVLSDLKPVLQFVIGIDPYIVSLVVRYFRSHYPVLAKITE